MKRSKFRVVHQVEAGFGVALFACRIWFPGGFDLGGARREHAFSDGVFACACSFELTEYVRITRPSASNTRASTADLFENVFSGHTTKQQSGEKKHRTKRSMKHFLNSTND